MKKLLALLVVAGAALLLWWQGSDSDYGAMAAARDARAQSGSGDIVVAAVMDSRQTDYVNGIRLAVRQLNERPGKVLGREVRLRVEQAADEPAADMALVNRIARDDRVVAVLGHRASRVALPASLVYESARVVFLPPFATRKNLTGHDFQYVFRMAPSSPVMAEQLASLAASLDYGRVAILHARDEYSREMAFLFEDAALARGLRIARRSSFQATDEDYRGLVAELRARAFDAVFLSAASVPGARMARQLRELGVRVPIIGVDTLDPALYAREAGDAAEGTIVPVLYRAGQGGARNAAFARDFQAAYGREADANAAQGYDAMLLLAGALETAKTTRTSAIASALRFSPFWMGVTGLHAFDQRGELLAKHYQFQWRIQKAWRVLPGLQVRHQVESAEDDALAQGRPLPVASAGLHADTAPRDVERLQLDLARRVLRWQRLGVLLALAPGEAAAEAVQQLRHLAEAEGGSVEVCVLRAPTLVADLPRCVQALSPQADALMLAQLDRLGPAVDGQALEAALRGARLPVFALSANDSRHPPPGLALYLDLSQHQDDFPAALAGLEQLVPRQGLEAVSRRLSNLPVLKADLQGLQRLGVQRSAPLLALFGGELPAATTATDGEPAPAPRAAVPAANLPLPVPLDAAGSAPVAASSARAATAGAFAASTP